MDASMLSFNAADPGAWRERMVGGAAPEAEKLQAATREFEAVLLRQYLSEALKPLTEGQAGLGSSNPVYGYMITDSLASSLSEGGVFGFSSLLQAQVAGASTNDNDTTNHTSS
jgi:Rod binding domain-containing protein